WWSPLMIVGNITLFIATMGIICQIAILFARNESFPLRIIFMICLTLSMISSFSTFVYTFTPLLYWKENRITESHSRTTAVGTWYMSIQGSWYIFYGILYIWFFACNDNAMFSTMLLFDYCMRFILCFMHTWSPPEYIICLFTTRFFTLSI
ncbi:hypothetical protein CLU79DRAFT_679972, partial [Phycomyces nitens]